MTFRMSLVVGCLAVVACGVPVFEAEPTSSVMTSVSSDAGVVGDAGVSADAGGPVDAGAAVDAGSSTDAGVAGDAGVLTWERNTQPIFMRHCTRCHEAGNGGLTSFADRYDVLGRQSTMCAGQTVATCIGWVLSDQGVEGGQCRTWEVRAFHRAAFPCVSAADVAVVQAWIAGGLVER